MWVATSIACGLCVALFASFPFYREASVPHLLGLPLEEVERSIGGSGDAGDFAELLRRGYHDWIRVKSIAGTCGSFRPDASESEWVRLKDVRERFGPVRSYALFATRRVIYASDENGEIGCVLMAGA